MASVTTFHACLDVVDTSRPTWAIFENVESIDREVDPDTHLVTDCSATRMLHTACISSLNRNYFLYHLIVTC